VRLLLSNFGAVEKALAEGSAVVFEESRVRIRLLPIKKELATLAAFLALSSSAIPPNQRIRRAVVLEFGLLRRFQFRNYFLRQHLA